MNQRGFVLSFSALVLLTVCSVGYADNDEWGVGQSGWLMSQMRRAETRLSKVDADILVVPVQAAKPSFDFIERNLITALIADTLRVSSNAIVPDPMYTSQALGSQRSQFDDAAIQDIATLTSAERILVGETQLGDDSTFVLTLRVLDAADGTELGSRSWTDIDYSDERPPSRSIVKHLPAIAEFALGQSVKMPARRRYDDDVNVGLPESFEKFSALSKGSPILNAASLQFLGMLHPFESHDETRSWLFMRSLVELQKADPASRHWRLLAARAYAYLDRRPAALHALGEPESVHERAMYALIEANLPPLEELVSETGFGMLDIAALDELIMLESNYYDHKERSSVEVLMDRYPAWGSLLHRALQDDPLWSNFTSATTKHGLEQLLPSDSPTLSGFLEAGVLDESSLDEVAAVRLLWRHLDSFEQGQTAEWGAELAKDNGVSPLDLIDLARETVVSNIYGLASDDLRARHTYEQMLQRLDAFEPFLDGHPALEHLRSYAYASMRSNSKYTAEEKRILDEKAREHGRRALAWTGQFTPNSVSAAREYDYYFPGGPDSSDIDPHTLIPRRFVVWPRGSAWHSFGKFANNISDEMYEECIAYAWSSFICVREYIERQQRANPRQSNVVRNELFAKYENRFIGNPRRTEFEIQNSRMVDDPDEELAALRAMVASGNQHQHLNRALAQHLFRRGLYKESRDALLAYAAFKRTDGPITINEENYAYATGNWFYWAGQHELAEPVLQIAAGGVSGSGANMMSRYKLSLMKRDYDQALQQLVEYVNRYSADASISPLLQLLHATGNDELAWQLFDQILPAASGPALWFGSYVGHGMAGTTLQDLAKWSVATTDRRNASFSAGGMRVSTPAWFLTYAGLTDRPVSPDLVALITEVEDTTRTKEAPPDPLVADPRRSPTGLDGKSRMASMAHAMTAFLNADMDTAYERFDDAARTYKLIEYLPYHVFAAASLQRHNHLLLALQARESGFRQTRVYERSGRRNAGIRFNENMSYAIIASFDGRHNSAIQHLRDALNDQPASAGRTIYAYYQLLDIGDRLYENFGIDGYRRFVLDLARRRTVITPTNGWAYFFIAKYSDDEQEKVRALASGLYLDPLSARGNNLPRELHEKAQSHLERFGAPFLDTGLETT